MSTLPLETAASKPRRADRSLPATSLREVVGQVVDVSYALWLATLACTLMATVCLATTVAIYLIDAILTFNGGAELFGSEVYFRLFELTVLFSAGAVAAHFLRLRLEAIRRAAILVPLPNRIVANPPGGDTFSKFECSCKVTLALDDPKPLEELKLKSDMLETYLQTAFVVAVTDPVIRFSKAKMEHTLKVAAIHVLGPGVSNVVMSEVRQRRVPIVRPSLPADADDTPATLAVG